MSDARRPRHTCHALGCETPVPPRMWGCKRHWFAVPAWLRARVWATYVSGQEIRKDPSPAYVVASEAAIAAVAVVEGRLTREAAQDRIDGLARRVGEASIDLFPGAPPAPVPQLSLFSLEGSRDER